MSITNLYDSWQASHTNEAVVTNPGNAPSTYQHYRTTDGTWAMKPQHPSASSEQLHLTSRDPIYDTPRNVSLMYSTWQKHHQHLEREKCLNEKSNSSSDLSYPGKRPVPRAVDASMSCSRRVREAGQVPRYCRRGDGVWDFDGFSESGEGLEDESSSEKEVDGESVMSANRDISKMYDLWQRYHDERHGCSDVGRREGDWVLVGGAC